MSKLLPNLVMVLAFGLCGLCVFQWDREGDLRQNLAALNDELYQKKETIQGLELTVKRNLEQIDQLEQKRKELTETKLANEKKIRELEHQYDELLKQKDRLDQQLQEYQAAIQTANERILEQNESIKKANEVIQTVAAQRDERAAQLVKVTEEYNQLVKDYNKLVDDVNKLNEAATGSDSRRK
ncbi:MAG: hypothetical protein FJ387_05405 [Verrucomicrobia bacterium]|nr:hypothetical protein [Verrucomicrobiota bacterium]